MVAYLNDFYFVLILFNELSILNLRLFIGNGCYFGKLKYFLEKKSENPLCEKIYNTINMVTECLFSCTFYKKAQLE